MKSIVLVVAFVAAANAVSPAALGAQGFQGADTSLWTPFKCREGVLGPNDDRMKDIGACPGISGPGKTHSCVFFCQAKALGVLNGDGLPTTAIYDKWVETVMPERHHQVGKAWFRNCFEKYGKNIKKDDASCLYAQQFGDCTWSVQPQLTCPKA